MAMAVTFGTKSDVSNAVLRLNPGEDKKTMGRIRMVSRLREKANRTGEILYFSTGERVAKPKMQ